MCTPDNADGDGDEVQERSERAVDLVTFEAIAGPEGVCLAVSLDDGRTATRIAGPKPWGGGTVRYKWQVPLAEVLKAIGADDCPDLVRPPA